MTDFTQDSPRPKRIYWSTSILVVACVVCVGFVNLYGIRSSVDTNPVMRHGWPLPFWVREYRFEGKTASWFPFVDEAPTLDIDWLAMAADVMIALTIVAGTFAFAQDRGAAQRDPPRLRSTTVFAILGACFTAFHIYRSWYPQALSEFAASTLINVAQGGALIGLLFTWLAVGERVARRAQKQDSARQDEAGQDEAGQDEAGQDDEGQDDEGQDAEVDERDGEEEDEEGDEKEESGE